MNYTVTVHIANPNTKLSDGGRSAAGHIWYSVSNGVNSTHYGFAPAKAGTAFGPGVINTGDNGDDRIYLDTSFSLIMNITQDQYNTL